MVPSGKCVVWILAALHFAGGSETPDGRGLTEGVCWEAISPDSWPVKEDSQVCGTDGVLYPSKTAIECISKQGGRVEAQEREKCSEAAAVKFDPCLVLAYVAPRKVCGSDNVTYTNVWHMVCTSNMHRVEISVQHDGECDIECPYSPIYKPVCSSTDYTFANEEALKCRHILQPYAKTELQHLGLCKRQKAANPCHVSNSYTPACASNGRTFASAQHVRCLKAANADLKVLHDGPCTVQEVKDLVGLDDVCRMAKHRYEWNPLCGSDNTTYVNAYTFLCASKDKELEVLYTGECGAFDFCREPEPADPSPICGNDGVTYPHENAFYCAQSSKRYLNKKHDGPCDEAVDDPCLHRGESFTSHPFLDNNGKPVCASDSITYVSPQALWCASKSQPDIKFIYSGECF